MVAIDVALNCISTVGDKPGDELVLVSFPFTDIGVGTVTLGIVGKVGDGATVGTIGDASVGTLGVTVGCVSVTFGDAEGEFVAVVFGVEIGAIMGASVVGAGVAMGGGVVVFTSPTSAIQLAASKLAQIGVKAS